MKIYAALAILLLLAGAVAYVDRSAVARHEAARIVDGLRAAKRNAAIAAEVAGREHAAAAARADTLAARLAALPPAPSVPPAPEPTIGAYCRPGCLIRWTDEPDE